MKHATNPGGWHAGYFPTVMDGPVLRLRQSSGPGGRDSEVNVGREGLGGTLTSAVTPELVSLLWNVHQQLRETSPDPYASICEAMGPTWIIDRPALFSGWPGGDR